MFLIKIIYISEHIFSLFSLSNINIIIYLRYISIYLYIIDIKISRGKRASERKTVKFILNTPISRDEAESEKHLSWLLSVHPRHAWE